MHIALPLFARRRSVTSRVRSLTECNLVHDSARHEREYAGDHQGADKDTDHGPAVALDRMVMGIPDAKRQHDQSENRQEMNRTPRSPQPELMNPERADRDRE